MANGSLSDRINHLFDEERWEAARRILLRELHKTPADHWLLTRLSTTYYEERQYEKAVEVARQAYGLAPDCPLVLWDLAGALAASGEVCEAIRLYYRILRRPPYLLAFGEHGEGREWAEALVTDCWYRLALCMEALGDKVLAASYLRTFLERLDFGAGSIYGRADAARQLKKLHPSALNFRLAVAPEHALSPAPSATVAETISTDLSPVDEPAEQYRARPGMRLAEAS